MAVVYKILGQAFPTPNTFVDLYTVPTSNSAAISTLNICNTSSANVTFRVMARPKGNTIAAMQYIVYDAALPGQDAIGLTLGMTLAETDKITVFTYQGNVAFTLFGTEIY